jgi:flagellar hook-associated protein 1
MPGLFSTFNIAKSGLFAQQTAIDVTSHNIANANSDGYTRQRANLQASEPYCMPSFDNASGPGQMGTGVDVASISRVKDNFLDYQIRNETGIQGWYSSRDSSLSQVENIFTEPSDTGISSLLDKFFSSWQELAKHPDSGRTAVVQQSQALATELNHAYSQLSKLRSDNQTLIKNTIFNVNNTLSQLNKVNEDIMQVSISGNNPNDLLDSKDKLLDSLSKEMGITINDEELNGIDVTTANDPVDLNNPQGGAAPLDSTTGKAINIVQLQNPQNSCRFSYISSIVDSNGNAGFTGSGNYTLTYYKNGDMTTDANKVTISVALTSEGQYKSLDESRTLWSDNSGKALKVSPSTTAGGAPTATGGTLDNNATCNFNELKLFEPPTGEFKGYMSVQDDISGYVDNLNSLAKAIALSVNAVHSQSNTYTPDTLTMVNNFFVNKNNPNTVDGENSITAENISLNSRISAEGGEMNIQIGVDSVSGESDGSRALAIANLANSKIDIQKLDSDKTLSRSGFVSSMVADDTAGGVLTVKDDASGMEISSYFKDVVDKLGTQEQQAKRMITNQQVLLSGFQQSKESTSGVSMDEEMANLIQYQHAYQANAKIISTVDQLLDVVINNLKR